MSADSGPGTELAAVFAPLSLLPFGAFQMRTPYLHGPGMDPNGKTCLVFNKNWREMIQIGTFSQRRSGTHTDKAGEAVGSVFLVGPVEILV